MDQMSKQQYAVIAPIRCQPEEKRRLEAEAAKKGLTLANYIRRRLGLEQHIARARTDLMMHTTNGGREKPYQGQLLHREYDLALADLMTEVKKGED